MAEHEEYNLLVLSATMYNIKFSEHKRKYAGAWKLIEIGLQNGWYRMQIHTFRVVKLNIAWSISSDSVFINGPKPAFYTSSKKTWES